MLFAPVETLREIASRPDLVTPLVLILLVSLVTSIIVVPRVDFETAVRESMAQANPNLSEADLDRMVRFSAAFAKVFAYASPLLTLLILAIIAGVLLLAFRLFGGEGSFKQAFSVTLYAWIPLVIQGIAGAGILLARGSVPAEELGNLVMSNPGFLVDMKENPVVFALLSSIDVFTFWSLALFVIGFSFLSRFSMRKSAAIVLTLWVVLLMIPKIGLAQFGAMRAAGA
ncbi:MAG TPA: YIP1 family protein [Thermoanaerobaculia bacterium]|nr:YIP1 family protein [Thermoanaerobaculia bacterium]